MSKCRASCFTLTVDWLLRGGVCVCVCVKPRFQGHYSLLFLLPFIIDVLFATAGGQDSLARVLANEDRAPGR